MAHEPSRAEVDALAGPAVIEFGATWCGHCRAIQAPLAAALARHPEVRHIRVEDGPGRPLGRSYRVKLWPTLLFCGTAARSQGSYDRQARRSSRRCARWSDQRRDASSSSSARCASLIFDRASSSGSQA
jgi:thiol-disulfide isomerase/thioredoxin